MFTIHIEHGTYHFHLTFGINQSQKLMYVTICIPQREYSISGTFRCQNLIALHSRIFTIYILQNVRMNQQMIKCRIKNCFLCIRSSFYSDTWQVIVPLCTGIGKHLFKVFSRLFFIQIQTGILYAYKGNSHLYFDLFSFLCFKSEVSAHIVTCYFFSIAGIQFIFALVAIPFCFHTCHRTLLFPISGCGGNFVHSHHKIDGKYSLGIITESTQ